MGLPLAPPPRGKEAGRPLGAVPFFHKQKPSLGPNPSLHPPRQVTITEGEQKEEPVVCGNFQHRNNRLEQENSSNSEPEILWTTPVLERGHPTMTVKIGNIPFKCLIDTGADKTILRQAEVPQSWELLPGPRLHGVGGLTQAFRTRDSLVWEDPEGTTGRFQPLIADISTNLLGRDLLESLDVVISSDTSAGHHTHSCETARPNQHPQY